MTNTLVLRDQLSNGAVLQPTKTVSGKRVYTVLSILSTHHENLDVSRTQTISMETTLHMVNSDHDDTATTRTISLPLWAWAVLLLSGLLLLSSSLIVVTLIGARCLWYKRRKYYTHIHVHQTRGCGLEEQDTRVNDTAHQSQDSDTAVRDSTDNGNRSGTCNNIRSETTTDPRVESPQQPTQLPQISDESSGGDHPIHMTRGKNQERAMPMQLRQNRSDTSLLSIDNTVPSVSTFKRAPRNNGQTSTTNKPAAGDMEMVGTGCGGTNNVNNPVDLVAVYSSVDEVMSAT